MANGVPTDPRTDASSVRNTKLCPYYVFHLHSESAIKKEQHTLDVALFFYYMDAAKRPSRFLHRHSPLSDRLGKSGAPGLVGGGNLCASAPIAMARAENSPHAHSVSRAQAVRTTFEKKKAYATCLSLANPGFFERYPSYIRAVRTRGVLRTRGTAYTLRTRWSCLDFPFHPLTL